MFTNLMNGINLDVQRVEYEIKKLQTSIQALESTFSKLVEGDSNLEMVEELNECKQKYDEILERYQALFLKNVESTKKSTDKLIGARSEERRVGKECRYRW